MKTQQNAIIDDEHFFEGAEKRLEVDFLETANNDKRGLLNIPRKKWEEFLATVNCLIIMIKTCGNTTLLGCLDLLIQYSQEVYLRVDFVTYSHKSFVNPELQDPTYRTFDSEIQMLNRYFNGNGYTLGPMNGERWFVYVADMTGSPSNKEEAEQTIEIMMTDLDRKAMSMFYKSDEDTSTISAESGITAIIPHSLIDDMMFEPCGYSMNGLHRTDGTSPQRYYSTIHITPEPDFSYVSYETNLPVDSYDDIIRRVLHIFKPGHFIVSVFADAEALCGESNKSYDCKLPGYTRTIANTCEFVGRRSVTCSHYSATHTDFSRENQSRVQ